jgi:hypothetical protein
MPAEEEPRRDEMRKQKAVSPILGILLTSFILAGCIPSTPEGPCSFTSNASLTIYRLPDSTSDVFGTMSAGETHEALARTAEGWVGFDPGFAQAGNIGLAHHRWFLTNASLSTSCLASVDLVTLADVEADVAASGG